MLSYGSRIDDGWELAERARLRLRLRSRQGKMEKSFLSFIASHPDWTPPADGENLLRSLSQFRDSVITEEMQQAEREAAHTRGSFSAAAGSSSSVNFGPPGSHSMSQSRSMGPTQWSHWSALSARSAGSVGSLASSMGAGGGVMAASPSAGEASCYFWLDKYYERHAGDNGNDCMRRGVHGATRSEQAVSVVVVTRGNAQIDGRGRASYIELQPRRCHAHVV